LGFVKVLIMYLSISLPRFCTSQITGFCVLSGLVINCLRAQTSEGSVFPRS